MRKLTDLRRIFMQRNFKNKFRLNLFNSNYISTNNLAFRLHVLITFHYFIKCSWQESNANKWSGLRRLTDYLFIKFLKRRNPQNHELRYNHVFPNIIKSSAEKIPRKKIIKVIVYLNHHNPNSICFFFVEKTVEHHRSTGQRSVLRILYELPVVCFHQSPNTVFIDRLPFHIATVQLVFKPR